jgi:malonyl-CoA/methylmalonyl-CoA synthetase
MSPPARPGDLSLFTPKHEGPTVFPNFFFFSRLSRLAYKRSLIAIRDLKFGYTASYAQLLTDVLTMRNALRAKLDPKVLQRLDNDEEVYVLLLGPASYEFTVGFFALMALGAVIVPISPALPVKEAMYFATKSRAVSVLSAQSCLSLGTGLEAAMNEEGYASFRSIRIAPHIMRQCLEPEQFIVSSDRYLDLNAAGYVIFTSGTTGPPKGAVKRRGFLYDAATQFTETVGIAEGDSVVHFLPVHHATGITVTLLPFLIGGGEIEFRSGGFDIEWTWERLRKGNLNWFSGVPTIYMRLMRHYEDTLSKLPHHNEYVKGVQSLRGMLCGTSALPRPLQQKWTHMRGGKPIMTRYGATEFGNAVIAPPWLKTLPDGAVGIKTPGIDMRLSNGDEGEVLIKTAITFSNYLFDDEATRNAVDSEGYFKTGDIARKDENGFYWILGRASIDIIKSGGYKLSALDVEREILALPYISEVMVVGVEDEEFGQRVAAAIVLRENIKASLSLDEFRGALRSSLAGYKMPTILRIVPELRKNTQGKVIKKVLVKELFPDEGHPDVQRWNSKPKAKI